MNIWKDISKNRVTPERFEVVIEITKGSKVKYELDKETGLLKADRILYTSTQYPMNYGFVPLTYADDNDPLDVFVLSSQPLANMCLVQCFPIGIVTMLDAKEEDQKIVAIPCKDPQYNSYQDINDLPKHIFKELIHFLKVYKELENKTVEIKLLGGKGEAVAAMESAMKLYEQKLKAGEI